MEFQSRNNVINAYRSELIQKVRRQTADFVNERYPDWREVKITNSNKLIDRALEMLDFIDEQMMQQAEIIDQINEATSIIELRAIEKAVLNGDD